MLYTVFMKFVLCIFRFFFLNSVSALKIRFYAPGNDGIVRNIQSFLINFPFT